MIQIVPFSNYQQSVTAAMNALEAGDILSQQTDIMLKPNLVNDTPYPVTTHPECCAAVIEYIRQYTSASIVIAEGNGDPAADTLETFRRLKYDKLAARYRVKLIDLNTEKLRHVVQPQCTVFPEMRLPEIIFSHYLISLPVLKAHSLSGFTGSLKNMIGIAPPKYYSGIHGFWKKALFHDNIHQAILDLNCYRQADFTLMDAVIGLKSHHLGGDYCDPPLNSIIAGYDPAAVDRAGASLLGLDWQKIPHLSNNKR